MADEQKDMKIQIWIALCHDRHLDPDVEVFQEKQDAVSHARKYMNEHIAHPDRLYEEDIGGQFWIMYELESDYATVFEKTLN